MTAFLPPARFLDNVTSDVEQADAWWTDLEGAWAVMVHEGTAYTVCLGMFSVLEAIAVISGELWEGVE